MILCRETTQCSPLVGKKPPLLPFLCISFIQLTFHFWHFWSPHLWAFFFFFLATSNNSVRLAGVNLTQFHIIYLEIVFHPTDWGPSPTGLLFTNGANGKGQVPRLLMTSVPHGYKLDIPMTSSTSGCFIYYSGSHNSGKLILMFISLLKNARKNTCVQLDEEIHRW